MRYTKDEETLHKKLMESILQEIAKRDLPTFLKGGTALLLCLGLDRFSE